MSKKVELIFEIDEAGKIFVTPKGTKGRECIDLMAFLDKIDGLNVIETVMTEDIKSSQVSNKNAVKEKI